MDTFLTHYSEAAKTSVGFFWKAGWAFVLGYIISSMIQVFVPKKRLTEKMGQPNPSSIGLSTMFGAISSSCSFAALATARSLLQKGAHFIASVAFMFASTNLVIELGILIFIFLGWQYLAAEVIGGLILIAISSVLFRVTYPQSWIEQARKKVENEGHSDDETFDWKQRIRSKAGWGRVGKTFVGEWQMVWKEILVGFTIAGFIAVFVPSSFWESVFLADAAAKNPQDFWVALQNALIAPFAAAATFIGSMGNIPLAAVLNQGGVMFAGIMGFIYSDLMVPPLVKVNAKYYGWRVALYIAGIMYVSIVATALILHYLFLFTGLTPESVKQIHEITQFAFDYSFFLNIAAILATAGMIYLNWVHKKTQKHAEHGGDAHHDHGHHEHHHDDNSQTNRPDLQTIVTFTSIGILISGVMVHFLI